MMNYYGVYREVRFSEFMKTEGYEDYDAMVVSHLTSMEDAVVVKATFDEYEPKATFVIKEHN